MKKIRNILSLALVFIMLIGLMPMNVFAADTPGTAEPTKYNITIVAKNGSVMASVNGVSVKKAEENVEVTLVATADDGYEFDSYKVTGAEVTVSGGKFTMPAADITVTATFKKTLDTVKKEAKEAVDNLPNLSKEEKDGFKNEIDSLDSVEAINAKLGEATTKASENAKAKADADKKAEEEAKSGYYNVDVYSYANGTAKVSTSLAKAGQTITVTATPNYGYAVKSVYYKKADGTKVNINNYAYNDYYYYGYKGKYYNGYYGYYGDYYRYYSDYEKYYYTDYSSYDAYLKDRHYSFWNNGYKYWDYDDYDYYKYYDKYGYKYYDRYYDDYYKYYDEYLNSSYKYSSYSNYLYNERYSHYKKYDGYYDYYDRYYYGDYRYYGYTTSDTFTMPASNVTVYVEFTDWSYYGYYYDDYYYYRDRKYKKDNYYERQKKAEQAKKEEEEAKAKEEAAKVPQVYENKAVITIGSTVLDKVSNNVHTVHAMDTPAYVKNGRVMLPLRYVAEALGLQVSWVPETKTVIIWDLTQRVEIPVKSNRIIVNGITYTSDVKPEIKSSRTMLPIANIARALGLVDGSDIYWDQYNKQVTLTRKVLSK